MPDPDESAIDRLLLAHWDVLGVEDVDVQPEVEYEHQAAAVLALLGHGSEVGDVTAYLGEAAAVSAIPAIELDLRRMRPMVLDMRLRRRRPELLRLGTQETW